MCHFCTLSVAFGKKNRKIKLKKTKKPVTFILGCTLFILIRCPHPLPLTPLLFVYPGVPAETPFTCTLMHALQRCRGYNNSCADPMPMCLLFPLFGGKIFLPDDGGTREKEHHEPHVLRRICIKLVRKVLATLCSRDYMATCAWDTSAWSNIPAVADVYVVLTLNP